MFFKKIFPLLLGFFLLSAVIRIPTLNRPLSKHHEFCTALVLRILQIWHEDGAAKYHFSPVMSYPNPADKFINNNTTGLSDALGNFYYVSHPPLAYWFPHFVFHLLHVKPEVLSLQLFNLFFHFISSVFIYLIICLLLRQKPNEKFCFPALAGFLIYLFLPNTLWFHSNSYMSDMFVQNFWITGVYVALKIVLEKKFSLPWLSVFFLVTISMCLTEWLGYFFAFCVCIFSILKWKNDRRYVSLIFIPVIAVFFSLLTTLYFYSQINGIQNYLLAAWDRLTVRSGYSFDGFLPFCENAWLLWKYVFFNYLTGYFPVLILLGVMFLLLKKEKMVFPFDSGRRLFAFISLVPVLLHHVVFLNYSGHDFAVLKSALFISVAVGILYAELSKSFFYAGKLKVILISALMLCILQYYLINRPGKKSQKGDEYAYYREMGRFIRQHSSTDEVLFVKGIEFIEPQFIFYAQRNVMNCSSVEEAENFLKKIQRQKGKLFIVNRSDSINYFSVHSR